MMIVRNPRIDGSICENLININLQKKRCFWLRQTRDRLFYCRVFGFRQSTSGINGYCVSDGFVSKYDLDMLRANKSSRYNFCIYRIISPLVIIFAAISAKLLLEIVFKAFKRLSI